MASAKNELRVFGWVLAGATLIGGFVEGELTDRVFSLLGAVIGGVGTAVILLGLGAYFEAQERKRRGPPLSPEMRAVFDRMLGAPAPAPRRPTRPSGAPKVPPSIPLEIEDALASLIAQDAAAAARGQIQPRRLIPHHAIKRDVALAAYQRDCDYALAQLDGMNWTASEKQRRRVEILADFARYPAGIQQMGPADLDKLIALMKATRTDLREIEASVRAANPLYSIVDPL